MNSRPLAHRPAEVARLLGYTGTNAELQRACYSLEPQLTKAGVRVRKLGRKKFFHAGDLAEFMEHGKVTRK